MNKKQTISECLLTYFNDTKIATMKQLKNMLKTNSRMTVFRKLAQLGYVSSYSHSGKYYTLKKIARFNKHGIWCHNSVLFSKHRTLKNTLNAMIEDSEEGCTATELNRILKVKVEDSLFVLTKEKNIAGKKISGVFVYLSKNPKLRKKQELTRTDELQSGDTAMKPEILTDDVKAALIIFFSTLDEKQRRLLAGYESLKIGRGGDKMIADIFNLDKKTVARGRQELLSGNVDVDTIRNPGGGRKKNSKCD